MTLWKMFTAFYLAWVLFFLVYDLALEIWWAAGIQLIFLPLASWWFYKAWVDDGTP
jgi:hypothetical protein